MRHSEEERRRGEERRGEENQALGFGQMGRVQMKWNSGKGKGRECVSSLLRTSDLRPGSRRAVGFEINPYLGLGVLDSSLYRRLTVDYP